MARFSKPHSSPGALPSSTFLSARSTRAQQFHSSTQAMGLIRHGKQVVKAVRVISRCMGAAAGDFPMRGSCARGDVSGGHARKRDDVPVFQMLHGGRPSRYEREQRVCSCIDGRRWCGTKRWCRRGRRRSSELPKCTSQMRRWLDVGRASTSICSVSEPPPPCSFNSVHSRPFRKRMPDLC